jgi:hypothetical protein
MMLLSVAINVYASTSDTAIDLTAAPKSSLTAILKTIGSSWPEDCTRLAKDSGDEGAVYDLTQPIYIQSQDVAKGCLSISAFEQPKFNNGQTWVYSKLRPMQVSVYLSMDALYESLYKTVSVSSVTLVTSEPIIHYKVTKDQESKLSQYDIYLGALSTQSSENVELNTIDNLNSSTLLPLLDFIRLNKESFSDSGLKENKNTIFDFSGSGVTFNSSSLKNAVFLGNVIPKIANTKTNTVALSALLKDVESLPVSEPWEIFNTFYFATLFGLGTYTLSTSDSIWTLSLKLDECLQQKNLSIQLYFS